MPLHTKAAHMAHTNSLVLMYALVQYDAPHQRRRETERKNENSERYIAVESFAFVAQFEAF